MSEPKTPRVVFIRVGTEGFIVSQNINPGDLGFQDCLSGFSTLEEALHFAKTRLEKAAAEVLAEQERAG